jgi:hypothetical protein
MHATWIELGKHELSVAEEPEPYTDALIRLETENADWRRKFAEHSIDQLQRAGLSTAPALSHPHPADREAIARVIDPNCGWDTQDNGPRDIERRVAALSTADRILALSPTPSADRDTLVRVIFRNTGCSESCAEAAADAILSMEPLVSPPTPSAGCDGSE